MSDEPEANPYKRLAELMHAYRAVYGYGRPSKPAVPRVSDARLRRDVLDVAAEWRQRAMVEAFCVDAGPPPGRCRRLGEMKP